MNDRPSALVTGATRGLGLACARELGRSHHLLVGGRDREAVTRVCAELPSAEPFIADLTDDAAVAAACRGIDRLDVLVHSAGVAWMAPIAEVTADRWREMFAVNVFAVAELTRLLLPALRASHGLVVVINSGAGLGAALTGGPYCGSKFALRAFTDVLRGEERGRVRVTSIHPGRADTDMQRELWAAAGATYRPEDHMRPEDVAAAVRCAVDMPTSAAVESLTINPPVPTNP